jgi:hypothetical protein
MHHGRNKDIDHGAGLGSREALFGHSYYFIQVVAQPECPADHFRILSETSRPVVIRQNSVGMRARLEIVVFSEQPPHGGPKSERREHPSGNVLQMCFLDFLIRFVREIHLFRIGDRDQLSLVLHSGAH